MSELSQECLKECLNYNPDTGIFTWEVRPVGHFKNEMSCRSTNTRMAGKVCGYSDHEGYFSITIGCKLYRAHRLAWLYMTGKWPKDQMDHIDHDRKNNRWVNLREATRKENMKNKTLQSNNTSGVAGVCWNKLAGKWIARIRLDGVHKHLGSFEEFQCAVDARKLAEKKYGFHPNHGRQALSITQEQGP